MQYTKKQFFADVTAEATALREHATDEEKAKLDFDSLEPNSPSKCIYGLATGNCMSKRAAELINKCCQRFIINDDDNGIKEYGFVAVRKQVNGAIIEGFVMERSVNRDLLHFSSIEAYILLPEAKNKNLIAYIKGEKQKLVL
jgi:hypothetical protein